MRAVLLALLTGTLSLFRSRHALQLEIVALSHQLAVYQSSSRDASDRPTAFSGRGSRATGPAGAMPWCWSSPTP